MKNRGKSREIIFTKQSFLKFFIELVLHIVEKTQKIHLKYC
jgi:hypothetical protein